MLAAMQRRATLLALATLTAVTARPARTQARVAPTASEVRPRPLRFPADFGAHPATRTEWWYVTGVLMSGTSPTPTPTPMLAPAPAAGPLTVAPTPRFGFQVTFFRSRNAAAAEHPSRFAAGQLIFAHAALTDLAERRLRHDQRIARSGFGIAAADEGETHVLLRDWQLSRTGVASAPGTSTYRARVASDSAGFSLDLQFNTTQPLLLQGDAGYSRKGPSPEQASHYYSQPQLEAAGSIVVAGQRQEVHGRAWLDHEWSDSLLDPQAVGWDWIGMNLADGSALTAFRLRRADGSSVYAGGSFRAAGAPPRNFAPDEVRMQPGRTWSSARSRATYPVEWRIETPAGPFTVVALLDNQELDSRSSTGAIYWEGLSELRDGAGRVVGHGYLEMTGYAARLNL